LAADATRERNQDHLASVSADAAHCRSNFLKISLLILDEKLTRSLGRDGGMRVIGTIALLGSIFGSNSQFAFLAQPACGH
jgi:predicted nucleic acid-binding protein